LKLFIELKNTIINQNHLFNKLAPRRTANFHNSKDPVKINAKLCA